MYFSRRAYIPEWATRYSIISLYFITALLCAFLCGALYYAYDCMEHAITYERAQVAKMQTEVAQLYRMQEKQKKDQTIKERHEADLKKYLFAAQAPFKDDQIRSIINLAHAARVTILELHTQKEKNKGWYMRNDVQLMLKGSLSTIEHFLRSVATQHKLMQCKSIICNVDQQGVYTANCVIGCIWLV